MAAALQLGDGLFRYAAFDDQGAGPRRTRPERTRKMFGMPGRGIDRFLKIHAGMDVAREKLRDPLILPLAARRAPPEIGFPVAQRERRRQRGARSFAGRQRRRMAFFEPEHLGAGAEAEAEFGN